MSNPQISDMGEGDLDWPVYCSADRGFSMNSTRQIYPQLDLIRNYQKGPELPVNSNHQIPDETASLLVVFTFCEWLLVLLRNRRIRDTEHLIYRSASPPDDTVSTLQRNALSSFGVYTTLYHTCGVRCGFCVAVSPQSPPGT